MNHCTSTVLKSTVAATALALLAGCESTVYRAVPNVVVTRPNDVGSSGPLVLVVPNPAATQPSRARDADAMIDKLTVGQIGMLDQTMRIKLDSLSQSRFDLARLRQLNTTDTSQKMIDARQVVKDKEQDVQSYAAEWRDLQKKMAGANAPNFGTSSIAARDQIKTEGYAATNGPQTVLMISEKTSLTGSYETGLRRTVVVILDGPVKPGTYWLTQDNSVLIVSSAYSPPGRSRIALSGSIKVREVRGNHIVADVAIADTAETDTSEFIDRPYDPVNWQWPWIVTGKHTFTITDPKDPIFQRASVRWVME